MAEKSGNQPSSDVIVIGGGVIGCAIALRLARGLLKVTVLERGEFGGEASSAAAGMIAPQGEMVEFDSFFEFCAASRDLYPTFLEEIKESSNGNANWQTLGYRRDGILMVASDDHGSRALEESYQSQTRHGLALERLSGEALRRTVPGISPEVRWGVLVPGDHWVDNERLTPALVEAGRRLGVRYVDHTAAQKFNLARGRLESVEVSSNLGGTTTTYSAGCFILAAGCWSGELAAQVGIRLNMQPCRGQMIELESATELPLAVREGHHYLVPRSPRRILAGTTAEYAGYEKSVTGEGLRAILEGIGRFAPLVNGLRFRRAWAGLRPDTADHLPILGRGEIENLIFATGHFRNGILLAPITAQVIAELVLTGATSRPIDAYSPARLEPSGDSKTPSSSRISSLQGVRRGE